MTARPMRGLLRGGVVLAVTAVTALATALPALAHVIADPGTATQGGFTKIAFRVPDESDTAGTTKVEVNLPTDHPITSVQTTPIPGWTAVVTTAPLNPPVKDDDGNTITKSVSAITWTASPGNKIGPGQFLEFDVAMGPLPTGVDELFFPTLQTYDSGEVVSWIEKSAPGAPEPEHPAPSITLTPAAAAATAAPAAPAEQSGGSDTTARWLAIAGLAVGAVGLGTAAGAIRRNRRTSPAVSDQPEREPVA